VMQGNGDCDLGNDGSVRTWRMDMCRPVMHHECNVAVDHGCSHSLDGNIMGLLVVKLKGEEKM
jgi:hypothetical protein